MDVPIARVSLKNFSTRICSEVAKSLREKPVLQHSQIPGAPASWRQSTLGSLNAAPSCEPGLCSPCSFSSSIPTFCHLGRTCWFPCEQQLVSLSALYSLKGAARQWTMALQRATAEINNQKRNVADKSAISFAKPQKQRELLCIAIMFSPHRVGYWHSPGLAKPSC